MHHKVSLRAAILTYLPLASRPLVYLKEAASSPCNFVTTLLQLAICTLLISLWRLFNPGLPRYVPYYPAALSSREILRKARRQSQDNMWWARRACGNRLLVGTDAPLWQRTRSWITTPSDKTPPLTPVGYYELGRRFTTQLGRIGGQRLSLGSKRINDSVSISVRIGRSSVKSNKA